MGERGRTGRTGLRAVALALVLIFPAAGKVAGQETHLLVVVGLGGDASYRETFHGWAKTMIETARDRLGIHSERITYLGDRPEDAPDLMDGRSTSENVADRLARIADEAGPGDRLLLLLIGHGTGEGSDVEFNLPGPDLEPAELDRMLSGFPGETVAVVNAASSSGPFLPVLSGPGRVVLTATRTAQERNETQFAGFFVEALGDRSTDLDKDGRLSLAEAFETARQEVERYYRSRNLLATEHAQLDDDGDGEGVTELGEGVSDGALASSFWLGTGTSGTMGTGAAGTAAGTTISPDSIADPELRALYEEKEELERRVRELRQLRGQMEESRYENELEALLLELALKNREIRARGGGTR
jgi:hypothetical protein